jgi:hypothetical protein
VTILDRGFWILDSNPIRSTNFEFS